MREHCCRVQGGLLQPAAEKHATQQLLKCCFKLPLWTQEVANPRNLCRTENASLPALQTTMHPGTSGLMTTPPSAAGTVWAPGEDAAGVWPPHCCWTPICTTQKRCCGVASCCPALCPPVAAAARVRCLLHACQAVDAEAAALLPPVKLHHQHSDVVSTHALLPLVQRSIQHTPAANTAETQWAAPG